MIFCLINNNHHGMVGIKITGESILKNRYNQVNFLVISIAFILADTSLKHQLLNQRVNLVIGQIIQPGCAETGMVTSTMSG